MIAGILLAAGRSRRFGADKLCALIHGEPVVRSSIRVLADADEIVVVAPEVDGDIARALVGMRARLVANPERDAGMASSIRVGVATLSPSAEAVMIALADQPMAERHVARAVIDRWRGRDVDIVVPEYTDGRGHPVLFGRACFDALGELTGDEGARRLLDSGKFRLAVIPVARPMPVDVDTPDALALAAQRAADDASIHPPNV